MKLDDIFYGIAFISGLLGLGGLGGYCEMGTGLLETIVVLAICVVSAIIGRLESGKGGSRRN